MNLEKNGCIGYSDCVFERDNPFLIKNPCSSKNKGAKTTRHAPKTPPPHRAVLVFAREEWENPERLKHHARKLFKTDNILHLVPPHPKEMDTSDYFSDLGRQCGNPETGNSLAFMKLIEDRLAGDNRIFLLITRFEKGNEAGGVELSATLRSLNEKQRNLYILICGGERLADMYFCGGDLSLLNQAETLEWPELSARDVDFLLPDTEITPEMAENLLKITGGHPRLIMESRDFCRLDKEFDADACAEKLSNSRFVWKLFMPFRNDKSRLCKMLEREDAGPWQPYINDPLTRSLYWKNLLKRSANRKNREITGDAERPECVPTRSVGTYFGSELDGLIAHASTSNLDFVDALEYCIRIQNKNVLF